MTRQLDLERLLDTWLDEGPTDTADAVFDATVVRIYRQRQRPAWRASWRNTFVTTNLKLLIAAAAVIVIAVGGIALLGRPSTSVGNPSVPPSVSPSVSAPASPSTSPSASAVFPSWYPQDIDGAGILPAGSQTTRQFIAGTTFTVPEGWVNDGDYAPAYFLFPDTPANVAEYSLSKQKAQEIVLASPVQNNMFAICDATGVFPGGTAVEVIDFVVTNEALATTEPVEVTIDGLSGIQVDVQLNPDWTDSCPFQADNPTRDYLDERSRVIVLDDVLGRTIGIAIGSRYSADFDAFLADAMPIIESLDFPGPGASLSP